MDKQLQHPYVSVNYGGLVSFGGSQRRSQKRITRQCGCGVIACTDLSLYMGAYHSDCSALAGSALPIPGTEYNSRAEIMRKRYLPLFPRFGTNGWMLALGMNLYFRSKGIPFRASWGVRKGNMRRRISDMLSRDIPVILSIGQNFPFFWRRKKLSLYRKTENGYSQTSSVKAHYVTVTGMDDEWLHISSWGQAYSIRWSEFTDYVDRCSSWAISNILYIRRK